MKHHTQAIPGRRGRLRGIALVTTAAVIALPGFVTVPAAFADTQTTSADSAAHGHWLWAEALGVGVVGAATTQSEFPGNPAPPTDPFNLSVLEGLADLQIGTVSVPLIKPTAGEPGLLQLGNVGLLSSYSASPSATSGTASTGLINSDGSLNIDAAKNGQYGKSRIDANAALSQILTPELVNTLVDELAIEVGALGSRAVSDTGAATSEYMLSDLTLEMHSPAVKGLVDGVDTQLETALQPLAGLLGPGGAAEGALGGIVRALDAVPLVNASLGSASVSVQPLLDSVRTTLLAEPLSNADGSVLIDVGDGTISVDLGRLAVGGNPSFESLSSLPANTEVLDGPMVNAILSGVTDALTGAGPDSLISKVVQVITDGVYNLRIDMSLNLEIAVIAKAPLTVSGSIGGFLGVAGHDAPVIDASKVTLLQLPIGFGVQPLLDAVTGTLSGIGGPLTQTIDTLIGNLQPTLMAGVEPVVTGLLTNGLSPVLQNVARITINQQTTPGDLGAGSFTVRALNVSVLPNAGANGAVALQLGSSTVKSSADDPGTDPGSDPTVDPGADPGTDPGTDPGADPGTEPGADPGTDPGVDPGTDAGVDPGTDPGADPSTEPGTDPGTDPGADPGADPGTDPGTDPGADPGTDPGADPGTDPGADPGADPGTDPGADPGTDPGAEPSTDPGVEPGADPGTDPGTDPGVDPGTDTGVDPGADPGVDPGADPGTDPGADPGADPGTDPGADPGTDPGADPGTEPGADPGVDPGTDPGAEPSTDPGTEPGADPGTDPGADPGTDPGADPGVDPGTDPGAEPSTDPGMEPGADPGTDPGTEPGADPGTDPAADPGTEPGADPGTDPGTDPGADPGTDPGADPGTDPGADPGTDPGADPGTEPGAEPSTDPGTDPGADPGTDPGADPGTDPDTDPGADPGTDPGADPGTDPGADPGADPGTDPGTDPGADPGTDPGADPGTDPGADPGTDPDTDPGADPGTDPGADPGTDPGADPGTDPGADPGTDPGTDPGIDPGTDPGTDPGKDPGGEAALTATPGTVSPGGTVTLNGSGFLPGETVQLTLPLGGTATVTADASGAFVTTWKAPADIAPGAVQFTAKGLESGRTATASVTVVAAAVIPVRGGPGAPGAKGGGLAVTGFDAGFLPILTILTLMAGGGLLLGARRDRVVRGRTE